MSKPAPLPTPARRYRGASLQQRQDERRARLIEAGLTVIGTQGYAAATVRAICAEAGLTERYFYESFANREALLEAVYEQAIGRLNDAILAAVRSVQPPDPEEMSKVGLRAFYTLIERDRRLGRVVFFEILGVSASIDQLYRRTIGGFTQLLLQVSRPLYPGCCLPVRDEELVATGMIGAMIMIATRWIMGGYDKPLDVVVDSSLEIFNTVTRQLVATAQLKSA